LINGLDLNISLVDEVRVKSLGKYLAIIVFFRGTEKGLA
jgi:hypothetical protein